MDSRKSGKNDHTAKQESDKKIFSYNDIFSVRKPINPYDNLKLSAVLADFTRLDQINSIKSYIEELAQSKLLAAKTVTNTALPGLIGRKVKALHDIFFFNGTDSVRIFYKTRKISYSVQIAILNQNREFIHRTKLYIDDGRQNRTFLWNGKNSRGFTVKSGIYNIEIFDKDYSGRSFKCDSYIKGKVRSIEFMPEGTMMIIGELKIPLHNLADISI